MFYCRCASTCFLSLSHLREAHTLQVVNQRNQRCLYKCISTHIYNILYIYKSNQLLRQDCT